MYVIRLPDPNRLRLTGPFSSVLEAREYLADTTGDHHGVEVIRVEPRDPSGLVEPGL